MNQLPEFDARPVAFFDFDGTLTTGDTLMPFLKFVVGTPTYYAKLALLSPVLGAYYAKLLRNDIAKQVVLKQYLGGYHIDELFRFGERFSEEVIPTMLRPEGMERLRWHQAQGHECVLVSASMNVYLKSWAKRERFSGVICTALEVGKKGHVSGKIQGKNCHGDEKIKRIRSFMVGKPEIPTYAYGDTNSDFPMIRYVDFGYIFKKNHWNKVR
ncbi:HAD-superfamily subfamily IB hydrolase, TIGR01490 [Chromohalobacter canadensis]|uniref:HAD-superfamily subfamily IB hydrolase, TIGR01490 n=1 Tax=Chromohalobacter canadensis TaxID=141389 RepID=A0A285VU88_9GAMM|nr:HAD-IB family hydrolase [Chromohalobacter canadensis]SOC57447.1 HAD-superfamily subfamily IB hydrolase, TIGR01490 [Chromohalobacter canadensis]